MYRQSSPKSHGPSELCSFLHFWWSCDCQVNIFEVVLSSTVYFQNGGYIPRACTMRKHMTAVSLSSLHTRTSH